MVSWQEIRHQATISGVLTDGQTGKPVGGAQIRITDGPAEYLNLLSLAIAQYGPKLQNSKKAPDRTVTAPDGHFHFLNLPDGSYTLEATVTGKGSRYGTVLATALVSRNPDSSVNLAVVNPIVQPTTISGTITNQAGDPLPMASARVGNSGEQVFTDMLGTYRLIGVETGNRNIIAAAQGYEVASRQILINTAGTAQTLDFILPVSLSSPLAISGCNLWLRADSISGLTDGESVSNWPDGSGQGNHAAQSTVLDQPVFKTNVLAGRAVVRFNGVNEYLELPLVEASTNHTFVFVYSHTPTGVSSNYLFDAQSGRLRLDVADQGLPASVRWNDGSWHNIGDAVQGSQILSWLFSGTNGQVFRNSSILGSDTYDPTDIGGRVTIGATNNGNSSFFAGDIAEVLYYNRALTALERQQVEQYLSNRYSIPLA